MGARAVCESAVAVMKRCVLCSVMTVVHSVFSLSPEQEDGWVGSYGLNMIYGVESCSTRALTLRVEFTAQR